MVHRDLLHPSVLGGAAVGLVATVGCGGRAVVAAGANPPAARRSGGVSG